MPKQTFSLEPNGPKRLEITWNGFWKNFTVRLDGDAIINADGSGELKTGKSAILPDGSALVVKLKTGFGQAGLEVTRDGKPLPGTSTDPDTQVKQAGAIVYVLAGLNLLIGVIAYAFDVRFLKENFGYGPLIVAGVFAVLGYFTMKRSMAALIAAIAIYAIDGIVTLSQQFSHAAPGRTPNMGFIFMRVIFIAAMIRGARAMSQLSPSRRPALPNPPVA